MRISNILGRKPAAHGKAGDGADVEKQLHDLIGGGKEPPAQRSMLEGETLIAFIVSLSVVSLAVIQFVLRPFATLLSGGASTSSSDHEVVDSQGWWYI